MVVKVPAGAVKSSVNLSELPLVSPPLPPPAQLLPANAQTSTSLKDGKLLVPTWVKTVPPLIVSPVTEGSTSNPIDVSRALVNVELFLTWTWSSNSDEVNFSTV